MPITPPTNVTYGKVVWQVLSDIDDGPDGDANPDYIAPTGTVTITRSVTKLLDPTASLNPVTVASDIYVGILDSQGYLCTPDPTDPTPWAPTIPGPRGLSVIASDNTNLNPTGTTYKVVYNLIGQNGRQLPLASHSISPKTYVNPGDECDLTRDAPVDSSTGVPTVRGLQGLQGVRGSQWFTGHGAPGTIAGSLPGDQYLDLDTGDVYLLS